MERRERHVPVPPYEDDPLTIVSPPDTRWTTANTGEQMPGVLTPLTITLTSEPAELGILEAFGRLGVIPRSQVRMPIHRHEYSLGFFYGQCAANVKVIRWLFDLTPGTSGKAYEAQMFGGEGLGETEPLPRHRYPVVAAKMPLGILTVPRELRKLRAELQPWWSAAVRAMPAATLEQAKATCLDAEAMMLRVTPYVWFATTAAQLAYGRLCGIVAASGNAGLENTVCGGYGTEELEMADDLWAASRGQMSREDFLGRHGWTVPAGMEIAEPSWRETPEALDGLLESYRSLPESENPKLAAGRAAAAREEAEAKVAAGLPARRRPEARLTMRLARNYMQLRTIQKASGAITWDVMRASARRLGELLAEAGELEAPADVFQLTAGELLGERLPADVGERVARRRAQHEEYLDYRLPRFWTGNPEIEQPASAPEASDRIEGSGVSPGVVEGPVRVVTSPTDAEVKPGEILVCATTDPSWISLMVVASGLVIDVGGPVSHGAIVARELGVPCVINTRVGTSLLATGERVRIDGSTGIVERLAAK